MKSIFASVLIALALPSLSYAQALHIDQLTPPLPTSTERRVADVASWGTALVAVGLDTVASWQAPDRGRAFKMQGVRLFVTYGAALAVKKMVARSRPCADEHLVSEGCGIDDDFSSFYSAHAALAGQAVGGARLEFALPLAFGTAGLRVAAGKHYLTDMVVGLAAGLLTSRIR